MIHIISIFILLLIPIPDVFGETLTIGRFIEISENDYRLKDHDELVGYLKDNPLKTSYIDQIEVRTEINETDIAQQKYSIRIYPKNAEQTQCENNIVTTMKKAVKAEHEILFDSILKRRYEIITDFLETMSTLNIKKSFLVLYEDQIHVMKKMSVSDLSFDVPMIISARDRHKEIEFEIIYLENTINALTEEIKSIVGHCEIIFDEKEIIPLEKIETAVDEIKAANSRENIYVKYQGVKTELARDQYNLERAKENTYFNFISLGYDSTQYSPIRKAFSVEASVKLPFSDSNAIKIISERKNYIEEKLKYETEKKALSDKINSLCLSLLWLIARCKSIEDDNSIGDAEISLKKYSETEGTDPLSLLKIRESILKRNAELNKLRWTIRRQYIELIHMTGILSEKPLKNYISAETKTLP